MKVFKIVYIVIAVLFMVWALAQRANGNVQIWVQVVAVGLFFALMAKLMSKTPSNSQEMQNSAQREFDKGIKEDLIQQAKEQQDVKSSKDVK